ncbi:hypothetical protein [Sphaerotilus sp.]|uniref:hypothetical protein n=1 Tax=Sphaerotilus sp. TaxID=2093942 RepID=UPI002ACD2306|nr:hypothetical protein [Sphaerotilus sp.]MDZ7855822.1 hypothetical protein [Sphaerotilus sp.]
MNTFERVMRGPRRGNRCHVRLFVAAPLVAVGLSYGMALEVGAGFAPPPFPPDDQVAMRAPARHVEGPPVSVITSGRAVAGSELEPLPERQDAEPPWRFDNRDELPMRDH